MNVALDKSDKLQRLSCLLGSSTALGYPASILLVAAATLVCEVLRHFLPPLNLLMVYLVTVVLAALNVGLKPAILAVVSIGIEN